MLWYNPTNDAESKILKMWCGECEEIPNFPPGLEVRDMIFNIRVWTARPASHVLPYTDPYVLRKFSNLSLHR